MAYQALYRKYRPNDFSGIVGQEVTVKVLKNAIRNKKTAHAYIFFGPRGTGKTSIAKIFAKTINCENLNENVIPCGRCPKCMDSFSKECVDIIEIDAASNNGVDEIRELRNKVSLVPAELKFKIYIIDEVHMLSTGAFNALLKTLEEPPSHVVFILATTDIHKVPSTILSRCQTLEFKKIDDENMKRKLSQIANEEKISMPEEVIAEIVKYSDGGLRDAIGMFEKICAYSNEGNFSVEDVRLLNNTISVDELDGLKKNIIHRKYNELLQKINEFYSSGKDLGVIAEDLTLALRDEIIVNRSSDSLYFIEVLENLSEYLEKIKTSNFQKLMFELPFIKLLKKYNVDSGSNNETSIENVNIAFEKKEIQKAEVVTRNVVQILDSFDQIKKARVTNTFIGADKKIINEIRKAWGSLKDNAFDNRYGALIRVLSDDATPVAASANNIILNFQLDSLANRCNEKILEIEEILRKFLNLSHRVICVSNNEWKESVEDYKKNKDTYIYCDDSFSGLKEEKNDIIDKDKTIMDKAIELFGEINI